MRRIILIFTLTYLAAMAPAYARTADNHALGNMYTRALNAAESQGRLNTLDQKNQVLVTDIHMDHGQVILTVAATGKPETIVFDLIAGKVVPPNADIKK